MAQYGPETWWYPDGTVAALRPVRVFPRFSNILASLFSDAGMTLPLPNPILTDAVGSLTFFTLPGDYWFHINGLTFPVVIGDDYSWHAAYPHVQMIAQSIWSVTHNLNTAVPVVTTVDGTGGALFGSIMIINSNTVEIDFGVPTSGVAYIRR